MMFYLCVAALIFLHEVAGEKSLGNVLGSRRFTYEDGEYEISTSKVNWYTARNLCRLQGGELLSIETMGENSAVLGAIYDDYQSESFWTSGCEHYQEGSFYWDSAGGAVDFTNWALNEPKNGNSDYCLGLISGYNHLWSDENCYKYYFFICEYHPCSNLTVSNVIDQKKEASKRFAFEDSTYEIITTAKTWVDAKNDCKAKGMELVSIESFQENLAILQAIVEMREFNFWTSGNDWGQEGSFYWEATGQAAAPYTNWAPGMPDNGDSGTENCMHFWEESSHSWNDARCTNTFYYICELKACQ